LRRLAGSRGDPAAPRWAGATDSRAPVPSAACLRRIVAAIGWALVSRRTATSS